MKSWKLLPENGDFEQICIYEYLPLCSMCRGQNILIKVLCFSLRITPSLYVPPRVGIFEKKSIFFKTKLTSWVINDSLPSEINRLQTTSLVERHIPAVFTFDWVHGTSKRSHILLNKLRIFFDFLHQFIFISWMSEILFNSLVKEFVINHKC